MGLAPDERSTLTEIENELTRADPGYAAMFDYVGRRMGCPEPAGSDAGSSPGASR